MSNLKFNIMKVFKKFYLGFCIVLFSCSESDLLWNEDIYENWGVEDIVEGVADWFTYEYTDFTFFNPPDWIQGYWIEESFSGTNDDFTLTINYNSVNRTHGKIEIDDNIYLHLIYDFNRKLNKVDGGYNLTEEYISETEYRITIEYLELFTFPMRDVMHCTYISDTEISYKLDFGQIARWDNRYVSKEGKLFKIEDDDSNSMTYVPDDNFEQKLIDLGYDDKMNDSVASNNIKKVKKLDLSGKNISDLTGISDFILLTNLDYSKNEITDINLNQNLSQNKYLRVLTCVSNQFKELDVRNLSGLLYLNVHNNQLTNLDVSQNTKLEGLICSKNQLTTLDITQNTELITLNVDENQLETLNVSNNTLLRYLDCWNNHLTNLDVSKIESLSHLDCGGTNPITCVKVRQEQLNDTRNWCHLYCPTYSTNCD
jgi:hypothetical protein